MNIDVNFKNATHHSSKVVENGGIKQRSIRSAVSAKVLNATRNVLKSMQRLKMLTNSSSSKVGYPNAVVSKTKLASLKSGFGKLQRSIKKTVAAVIRLARKKDRSEKIGGVEVEGSLAVSRPFSKEMTDAQLRSAIAKRVEENERNLERLKKEIEKAVNSQSPPSKRSKSKSSKKSALQDKFSERFLVNEQHETLTGDTKKLYKDLRSLEVAFLDSKKELKAFDRLASEVFKRTQFSREYNENSKKRGKRNSTISDLKEQLREAKKLTDPRMIRQFVEGGYHTNWSNPSQKSIEMYEEIKKDLESKVDKIEQKLSQARSKNSESQIYDNDAFADEQKRSSYKIEVPNFRPEL